MSDYHLVCIHAFDKYVKGQKVTDPNEVDKLLLDREHHFNRVAIPSDPLPEQPEPVEGKSVPNIKVK